MRNYKLREHIANIKRLYALTGEAILSLEGEMQRDELRRLEAEAQKLANARTSNPEPTGSGMQAES